MIHNTISSFSKDLEHPQRSTVDSEPGEVGDSRCNRLVRRHGVCDAREYAQNGAARLVIEIEQQFRCESECLAILR